MINKFHERVAKVNNLIVSLIAILSIITTFIYYAVKLQEKFDKIELQVKIMNMELKQANSKINELQNTYIQVTKELNELKKSKDSK